MTPIDRNTRIADLDSWGSFEKLGAQIFEGGDVQAFGKMTHGAPTDAVSSGYFGTSKGKYRLVYPFSEQATLLQGEVRIVDESTGASTLYKSGDSWFVTKGTQTVWEVLTDSYTKHYFAVA
ncbi:cupin domain-containing protein [Trinickia dinghuensis]|nr:cupin domain-containing protein [Trinickia dinghuensis]